MADLRFRKSLGDRRLGALALALLIGALVAPAAAQASGGAVPGLSAVPTGAPSAVSKLAQTSGAATAASTRPSVPSVPASTGSVPGVGAAPVSPPAAPTPPAPPVPAPTPPVNLTVPVRPVSVAVPAVSVTVPAVKVPATGDPGGAAAPPTVNVPADRPADAGSVPTVDVPAVKVPAVNAPPAAVPAVTVPAVTVPAVLPSAAAGQPGARAGSPAPVDAVPASSPIPSARPGQGHARPTPGAHHTPPRSAGRAQWTGYRSDRSLVGPPGSGPFELGVEWAPAGPDGHLSSTGSHRLGPVLRIVAVRRLEPQQGLADATADAPLTPPVSASLPPGGAVSPAGGGGGAAGAAAAALLALAAVALLRALLPGLLAVDLLPWRSALLAFRLERPG
jgi:hypothetical protein